MVGGDFELLQVLLALALVMGTPRSTHFYARAVVWVTNDVIVQDDWRVCNPHLDSRETSFCMQLYECMIQPPVKKDKFAVQNPYAVLS